MSGERVFDTDYTDKPVCPHCGTEQGDAWEWAATETDATCAECDGEFHVRPDYSVSYTTTKLPKPEAPINAE